jgi:hypothetical protein
MIPATLRINSNALYGSIFNHFCMIDFANPRKSTRPFASHAITAPMLLIAALALVSGCKFIVPSNDRDWVPEMAQTCRADFNGDFITIHNIRNCDYRSTTDFDTRWYDKTYDLRTIQSVDMIVIPFSGQPDLAHVMTSFGFANGEYVTVSVEIRREKGESFEPVKSMLNNYELQYIIGDERDLVKLRANHRLDDVYIYKTKAGPAEARAMFTSMMKRTNKLADSPEFYNTLTNNCTTNIVWHVNELKPNLIRYGSEVLLPGHSPRLAYDLDLINKDKDFETTQEHARANEKIFKYRNSPDFSSKIRQ